MGIAKYTLEVYMPTLMYGILMDSWVNNHTHSHLLKYAPADIPKTEALEKVYGELMSLEPQGPYTQAIKKVRDSGKPLSHAEVEGLKKDLWSASCERLKDVYWQWGNLPSSSVDGETVFTFATLWATGRVCQSNNLQGYCTNEGFNKLGRGLVLLNWDAKAHESESRADLPELRRGDLIPDFATKIDELIDAVVNHLDWILTWPVVVQAIRSAEVGEMASDLTYHNPAPVPDIGG